MHDSLWLRSKELLKEGAIPIHIFDTLTRKRIIRILELREKQLEEQQAYLEEQARRQDAENNRMNKRK